MRNTKALIAVAMALMENPSARHWGYDLGKRADVRSGVLYPILGRMLAEGWLTDGWEEYEPGGKKRPPRRYYRLTPTGVAELGALLARPAADSRRGTLRLGLARLPSFSRPWSRSRHCYSDC